MRQQAARGGLNSSASCAPAGIAAPVSPKTKASVRILIVTARGQPVLTSNPEGARLDPADGNINRHHRQVKPVARERPDLYYQVCDSTWVVAEIRVHPANIGRCDRFGATSARASPAQ